MNTYIFTGSCPSRLNIKTEHYDICSHDVGFGFTAKVKSKSLRKALLVLGFVFSHSYYDIDNVYNVINSSGKRSSRIMKNIIIENPFSQYHCLTFDCEEKNEES